jgi:aspartate kinase
VSACQSAFTNRPVTNTTYAALKERLSGPGRFVVPGFYGRDRSGRIRCFPRGGADITGAIVARSVDADVYENWTDVPGLLTADPRVIHNPEPVAEVTYREQRELSYRGATVLHDETVFPVLEAGIPIQIRDTDDPAAPGTRVVTRISTGRSPIAGIAGRTGFSTVLVEKAMMNSEIGYGRRLLEIVESHGVRYEHSPTSIDSMSLVVRDEEIDGKEDDVIREITELLRPSRVEIDRGLALIAIVGEGMAGRVGIAAQILAALAGADINVRMVSQGVTEISLIVGVADTDYERAVKAIYDTVSCLMEPSRNGVHAYHDVCMDGKPPVADLN